MDQTNVVGAVLLGVAAIIGNLIFWVNASVSTNWNTALCMFMGIGAPLVVIGLFLLVQ